MVNKFIIPFMPLQPSKEEFWKMYKELPEELQEAIFSIENADRIDDICEQNGVTNASREIIRQVGNVLLGIIPTQKFEDILVKDVGLKKVKAQEVSRRIYRAVFYPVKMELEQLHSFKAQQKPLRKQSAEDVGVPEQSSVGTSDSQDDEYIVRQESESSEEREEEKLKTEDPYRESFD